MRKTKFLLTLLVALSMFGFMGCEGGDSPRPGGTEDLLPEAQGPPDSTTYQFLLVAEQGVTYDARDDDGNTANVTEVYVNDATNNVAIYQMSGIGDVPLPNGMLVRDDTAAGLLRTENPTSGNPGTTGVASEPRSKRVAVTTRARINTDPPSFLLAAVQVLDFIVAPLDAVFPPVANLAAPAGVLNSDAFGTMDFSVPLFHPDGSFLMVTEAPVGGNVLGALHVYQYNAAVGNIAEVTPLGGIPTGIQPREITHTPNGRFFYVANLGGTVSGYSFDPGTGNIAATPGSPYLTGGVGSFGITVERNGNFLYVTNAFSGDMTGFAINQADGSLTQISLDGVSPPGPIGAGLVTPTGMDNSFAADVIFVADRDARGVYAFRVDPATGVITQVSLTSVGGTQFNPTRVAVDPTNRFVVSSNSAGGDLTLFGDLFPQTVAPPDNFSGGLSLFRIRADNGLDLEQQVDGVANPGGVSFMQFP